jgi:hypothetical protein
MSLMVAMCRVWALLFTIGLCGTAQIGLAGSESPAGGPEGLLSAEATTQPEEPAAGGAPTGGPIPQNCLVEIKQLCQGVKPGGGRMRKCIQDNEGKLSPTCRQQVQERRERAKGRMQEVKAACEGDVKRFCPNLQAGGGRIRGCLKEHSQELSAACAQAIEQGRQDAGKHRGMGPRP